MTEPLNKISGQVRRSLYGRLANAAGREVAEVRVTPALWGGGQVWCAMALGDDGREVPLPKGGQGELSTLLREMFPRARWDVAQDYDTTTGILAEHVHPIPSFLAEPADAAAVDGGAS